MNAKQLGITGSLVLSTLVVAGGAMARQSGRIDGAAQSVQAEAAKPGFVMEGFGQVETDITRASVTVQFEADKTGPIQRSGRPSFPERSSFFDTPAEAVKQGEVAKKRILDAVDGLAVERESNASTGSVSAEQYLYNDEVVYFARVDLTLRIQKIDDTSKVCRALSAILGTRLTSVDFASANLRADRLAALSAATADARKDAKDYAESLGIRISRLKRVDFQVNPPGYENGPQGPSWSSWRRLTSRDDGAWGDAVPDQPPRRTTTSALVTFEYDIEDANPASTETSTKPAPGNIPTNNTPSANSAPPR